MDDMLHRNCNMKVHEKQSWEYGMEMDEKRFWMNVELDTIRDNVVKVFCYLESKIP